MYDDINCEEDFFECYKTSGDYLFGEEERQHIDIDEYVGPDDDECNKATGDFLFGDFVSFLKTSKNLPKSILGRVILFLMSQEYFDNELITEFGWSSNEEMEKEFETAVSPNVEPMKSGNNREIVDRLIEIIERQHFTVISYVSAVLEIYTCVRAYILDELNENGKEYKDFKDLADILTIESDFNNIDWDYLDKKAAELIEEK